MYIESIVIENIRAIEKLKITFPDVLAGWHVFIGDNGSGKSSLMKAISANLIGVQEINGILPVWQEWLKKGKNHGLIEVNLTTKYPNRIILERNKNGIVLFSAVEPDESKNFFSAGYGPFRRLSGGDEKRNKITLSLPKAAAHLSIFGEEASLTDALDWIIELDRKRIKEKYENQNVKNESQAIFDGLKNFINNSQLLPHNTTFENVDVDGNVLFTDGNKNQVSVLQLSDGYRSILSLMFDLIRQMLKIYGHEKVFENNNLDLPTINIEGIVLIDEVDAHLHPSWQAKIGAWFTTYFPNIQFIVTTHSPLICRASEKGSIWKLAAPNSSEKSKEITGVQKERLIFGNILDAYGTEVFGAETSIKKEAAQQRNRLGELYEKSMMGLINDGEDKEFTVLKQRMPTYQHKPKYNDTIS